MDRRQTQRRSAEQSADAEPDVEQMLLERWTDDRHKCADVEQMLGCDGQTTDTRAYVEADVEVVLVSVTDSQESRAIKNKTP